MCTSVPIDFDGAQELGGIRDCGRATVGRASATVFRQIYVLDYFGMERLHEELEDFDRLK